MRKKFSAKRLEELLFSVLMKASAVIVFGSLFVIIGTIIARGIGSMNLDMITKTPEGGYYLGKEGGVLNAIIGSFILTIAATVLALLISLPVVLYINIFKGKGSRLAVVIRMSLDFLWGIPSIVYGAFGFTIMMFFGITASLLAGIITVTLFILPIMARAMDEVISMVPHDLLEASYSLGATKYETAFKVATRQALSGIVSAALIAFGRGIGDAASVLFTAGFSDRIPLSLLQPAATLPLAIFFQLGTPFPEVQERAYASAFILTVLILIISILARFLTSRHKRNIIQ
ncbi:MAG TPA: ABC transporter permease subunit [Spirochaetota bacterium]|nr:ABC transporter permease subunit [Spirochaetota bacterium]HOD13374.1 ABC transporter permease subunit [Spirochaetota bacterium]HPG50535.1 ABC transporter permease subunit [Spirochaetota bacterium]HQL81559.1 ABC transporter permease subunit [Spirochaetota bacterium]